MMSTLTFSFLRRFASFTSCKETRRHQLLTAHSSLTGTSAHQEPGNSSRDVLPETQSPGSASSPPSREPLCQQGALSCTLRAGAQSLALSTEQGTKGKSDLRVSAEQGQRLFSFFFLTGITHIFLVIFYRAPNKGNDPHLVILALTMLQSQLQNKSHIALNEQLWGKEDGREAPLLLPGGCPAGRLGPNTRRLLSSKSPPA